MYPGAGRLTDDQQAGTLGPADHRTRPQRQMSLAQTAGPDLLKQLIDSLHDVDSTSISLFSLLWKQGAPPTIAMGV